MSLTERSVTIGGEVAPGFERVRDALEANAADAGDGGFAFAAYQEGRKVVDIWTESPETVALTPDLTPVWMSVTKAMTALCIQILWDRGRIDVDAPVADYWPEFASAGKERITVADVLTHRSGVMGARAVTDMISLDDGTGIDRTADIVEILAATAPLWEPGTQSGYQTLTYGWLLGELIRRVDGRDLGAFFREEVAKPLDVTASIGMPRTEHEHIPAIVPTMLWPESMPDILRQYMENLLALAREADTPAGISCVARNGVGALDRLPEVFNNVPGRVAPLGGSNLFGSAASVAKIFAAIAEPAGLGGVELVSRESVELFTTVHNEDSDIVLLAPVPRGLGYWRNKQMGVRPQAMGPNEEAFGHTGAGGQIGFSDPKARVGAAFVRTHYTAFPIVYLFLNTALYEAIESA